MAVPPYHPTGRLITMSGCKDTADPTVLPSNGNASSGSQSDQFAKYFESFLVEQSRDLAGLCAAASTPPDDHSHLRDLIARVISHYEHYYATKAASAEVDVGPMFSPSWTSTTENIFMWAGGWRPSLAFRLLQSKSGLQLEARLEEIMRGGIVKDLGDMSPAQIIALDR